ncbi:hypothetical protein EDB84DRAFT_1280083 [Lactarius hengduanensis]|nr:hypothetical protein EDB84DRAFT_1280083 [Lactarius hengduanensis]
MCLLQVLDLQKVVDRLCSDQTLDLRGFMFTEVEWDILDQLEDILEASRLLQTVVIVSKAEVALIYEVIPLIDRFTEKFEQMIMNEALHASLRHAAKTSLQVLNKYYSYTDHCDIYRLSILLHPRFKTYYFTHHKWPQGWIDEALDLL